MKSAILSLFVVPLTLPCATTAQQATPEVPAIHREVTNVIQTGVFPTSLAQFLRPHMPAIRTTRDGRLGVLIEGNSPTFVLMRPEAISVPFVHGPAGSSPLAAGPFLPSMFPGAPTSYGGGNAVAHVCLWDENPPVNVNGDDVYDVYVLGTVFLNQTTSAAQTQIFVTPTRVTVSNPKTATATITAIAPVPGTTTLAGTPLGFYSLGFEPTIVGDGRLLIVRIASTQIPQLPTPLPGNSGPTMAADIVYSYYPSGAPANPAAWTQFYPISHAPFDTRINTKFGFAMSPFRDASGSLIPDGADLGGSYPWMDRDAKNLFFEGVSDTLHYGAGFDITKYPHDKFHLGSWLIYKPEDTGYHQGVTVLGLWTSGKMVQIDTLNNDMDYAIGAGDVFPGPQWRNVLLFKPNTGVLGNETGKLLLGYGRATMNMPALENDNANIIDSIESKLSYRANMRPVTHRDVVWHINNSKQSDEFAFDDYLDIDALIVANMTGLMTLPQQPTNPPGLNGMRQASGWNRIANAFNQPVKLQNAAAASIGRWRVPDAGNVYGPGRLEPAATGGVHGKGFWLEDGIRLEFTLPGQSDSQAYTSHDWYVGLFVDSRFANDGVSRTLITFPDGSSVRMTGRSELDYCNGTPSHDVVARIPLPTPVTSTPANDLDDLVPLKGWAHFAFQIRRGGQDVEFLLDGIPYHRIERYGSPLFRIQDGAIFLGSTTSGVTGFKGWVDDFKVIGRTMDPETACNHAGGTLIGLQNSYVGDWRTLFAARFPQWAHDEISAALRSRGEAAYTAYANLHDYKRDYSTTTALAPAGTVHLRSSIHFPEGPLFHNAPRPSTLVNAFCLSCHHSQGRAGLSLRALSAGSVPAPNDPRRQPSQPPALIYGNIPAGLVQGAAGNQPATATVTAPGGQLIDNWMMQPYAGTAIVTSFSLLEALTFRELGELKNGDVVDPAKLGTNRFLVRANLDSAQGGIGFLLDGAAALPLPTAPYVVPLATNLMSAANHSVSATPALGAAVVVNFTSPVTSAAPREIARFQTECQLGAPKDGWVYATNALSAVTDPLGYVSLKPTSFATPSYATEGTVPGLLTNLGGFAGPGTVQGESVDRHVIVGFRVKYAGYYAIQNVNVASTSSTGNGGNVVIQRTVGATTTLAQSGKFTTTTPYAPGQIKFPLLDPGAMIWVCVGPNGDNTGDSFAMDFKIFYNETAF